MDEVRLERPRDTGGDTEGRGALGEQRERLCARGGDSRLRVKRVVPERVTPMLYLEG